MRVRYFRYTVTLEPHNRDWLFALDAPACVADHQRIYVTHLTPEMRIVTNDLVRQRLRYDMRSYTTLSLQRRRERSRAAQLA